VAGGEAAEKSGLRFAQDKSAHDAEFRQKFRMRGDGHLNRSTRPISWFEFRADFRQKFRVLRKAQEAFRVSSGSLQGKFRKLSG